MQNANKYNKPVYHYEGQMLGLSKIVAKLHPGATPKERTKYYARYFARLKQGVSIAEAIAADKTMSIHRTSSILPVEPQVDDFAEADEEQELACESRYELPDEGSEPQQGEDEELTYAEEEAVGDPKSSEEYKRALTYARNIIVTFRKYEGRTLAHVLETEPSYVEWMRKKLIDNESDAEMELLYGINKLYNDYPVTQDIIHAAMKAYWDRVNAANSIPATTSLADNPKLLGLLNLASKPAGSSAIVYTPQQNLDALSFEELQALQEKQAQEREELRQEQSEMDKRRPIIINRLGELHLSQKRIEEKLLALTPKVPVVSDHAVLRYIERVMGMDVEQLKRDIVGANDREQLLAYQQQGAGRYSVGQSHRVHIENNTVVTVLPK